MARSSSNAPSRMTKRRAPMLVRACSSGIGIDWIADSLCIAVHLACTLRAQAAILLDEQMTGRRLGSIEVDGRSGTGPGVYRFAVQGQARCGAGAPAGRATRVDVHLCAHDGDTAGIELDEAAAGLDGQLRAGVDHDLLPGREMKFLTDADVLPGADLRVLRLGDRQVVAGLQLDLPVQQGRAVLFLAQLRVAVGLDRIVSLVADMDALVVPDMFVSVTLGMDVDLFLALAVLDAQFVVAATPRGAECLEDGAGLVGGQLVRHLIFEVVQAACDEWLVGIAFEEGDQDFHPHTRYGDATVSTACPTAGYPQPATGPVIVLAMPVPVELD